MSTPGLFTRVQNRARDAPDAVALVRGHRGGPGITYGHLSQRVHAMTEALRAAGVRRGHKAVTMTRDPYDFVTVVYALLALGAVPVLVEPRLPRGHLHQCLGEVAPHVFVGEPLAHAGRRALGWGRGHVRVPLLTGGRLPGCGRPLTAVVPPGGGPFATAGEPPAEDLAMIAFTSGSTGVPKGAEYRYATLAAQVDALAPLLCGTAGGVLLSGFLPVVLLGPALGLTTLAPAVNHLAPARTRPERILRPLLTHRASVVAASPAVLRLLAGHCARQQVSLPSVERVVSFGAALRPGLAAALAQVLSPHAEVLSVYGATECLPVSAITAPEAQHLRATAAGPRPGTCLGRPVPGVHVRILDAGHEPDSDSAGVGEIAVAGPNVSPAYHARPGATAAAKSPAGCGLLHRTGDMGRLDASGRLWFHGRKAQRVTGDGFTLTTEDIEAATETVPGVRRTALVGVGPPGRQRAVLCAEPERPGGRRRRQELLRALRDALDRHPDGARVDAVLLHPGFPTDIRHNSKTDRARVAVWAARRLRRTRGGRAAGAAAGKEREAGEERAAGGERAAGRRTDEGR
ncbi:AMP-binding protein [Streptomyces sp. NPDC008001]|uniref:AMP-binding protein n=1 Tax=Streptomyces sp. NPDC008001 TaxID=3364804 RepID=UPI0036F052BA